MAAGARITVLGSASGISMPGRGHASVALEAGGGLYFFDLGEPVGRAMLEAGLPIDRLRAAFVSHMHSDHAGGLFQFVKNLHLYHNHPDYLPQVESFTLALPSEAVAPVKAFMAASYMFPERMNVRIDYLGIEKGVVWDDGAVKVTAHETAHMAGYRDFVSERPEYSFLRCQAFSYEMETGDVRVLYSGDVGSIDDIIGIARGVDLLVLEFGHLLPLGENLKKLRSLDIGKVVLTHIFPDYNERGAELAAIAEEALPGRVSVAAEGDVFDI